MQDSQQSDKGKIFCRAPLETPKPLTGRASTRQQLLAAVVFLAVAASFGLLWLAATNRINIERWLNPCGFKQRFNLPCPTCGMTTSALAFAQGKILRSFYIQPAAALLCSILVITAFLAFIIAVSGVYFRFLECFFIKVKTKYVIAALLAIIAAGWLVTLTRTLATNARN
jgi:hypothetical protein